MLRLPQGSAPRFAENFARLAPKEQPLPSRLTQYGYNQPVVDLMPSDALYTQRVVSVDVAP